MAAFSYISSYIMENHLHFLIVYANIFKVLNGYDWAVQDL